MKLLLSQHATSQCFTSSLQNQWARKITVYRLNSYLHMHLICIDYNTQLQTGHSSKNWFRYVRRGDKLCNQHLLCSDNNNTKQLNGSKEHQSADGCSWGIDAPCPFTKGIFLHSKQGVSVWTRQAPRGTFVQSADVHVGVRACMFARVVYLDARQLCVLGCTSTGINKWRGVMAENRLRAVSPGER